MRSLSRRGDWVVGLGVQSFMGEGGREYHKRQLEKNLAI
jgi:hypothetical protein